MISQKAAREIVGSLSKPSKMPGASYGLPISACNVGARLRAQGPGTNNAGYVNPCGTCYAAEGFYRTFAAPIQKAQHKRLASIADPRWTGAMIVLIRAATRAIPYFRWHDSGDLQSAEHLSKIAEIAIALPDVKFWLPTREARLVRDWLATNICPPNLAIRISAMATPSARSFAEGKLFSTVTETPESPIGAHRCVASEPTTETACGDCRACWDPAVQWIDYRAHIPCKSSAEKRKIA